MILPEMGICGDLSTLVDFPFVPPACESGVCSKNSAATGAAFFIGQSAINRNFDKSLTTAGSEGGCVKRSRWARIKNRKDLGVWGELCFAVRAMEEGLRAARPFGDPPGFDFLVHNQGKHIVRVQVKTTTHGNHGWYNLTLKTNRKPYKRLI